MALVVKKKTRKRNIDAEHATESKEGRMELGIEISCIETLLISLNYKISLLSVVCKL